MKTIKEDVVDKIMKKDIDVASKIIRLWGIAMLNHRAQLGDKAWNEMEKITSKETVTALAFISGFCIAGCPMGDLEKIKGIVPELNEEMP